MTHCPTLYYQTYMTNKVWRCLAMCHTFQHVSSYKWQCVWPCVRHMYDQTQTQTQTQTYFIWSIVKYYRILYILQFESGRLPLWSLMCKCTKSVIHVWSYNVEPCVIGLTLPAQSDTSQSHKQLTIERRFVHGTFDINYCKGAWDDG